MPNVLIDRDKLDVLANAISAKSGEALTLTLDEMVDAVDGIETGGGGITPTGNIDITSAGTTDVTNYATATVPDATADANYQTQFETVSNQRKWKLTYGGVCDSAGWLDAGLFGEWDSVRYNAIPTGTSVSPTESAQTIGGSEVMLEGAVTVNAIPSNYVGTGITRRDSTDLSASGATVSVPSGFYENNASKAVASGSEGTPTATKGTVTNHSVSITPSVTNTAGYISGGTHSGTAVSVSASELVSGSETKTANGTYDVTNLAELIVNVSGGGGNTNIETGTFKPSSDIAKPTISFSNTHTTLPVFAMMVDADGYLSTSSSNIRWVYVNWEQLSGAIYTSTTSVQYGEVRWSYRSSNASSLSSSSATITYAESSTGTSTNSYPRYHVTETGMYPNTNSTTRYWRSNRNYKWIAVWKPTT